MAEKTRYSDAELEEFRAVMIRTILPLLTKYWKKVPIRCPKKKRQD